MIMFEIQGLDAKFVCNYVTVTLRTQFVSDESGVCQLRHLHMQSL
jgi:hypothetical protein